MTYVRLALYTLMNALIAIGLAVLLVAAAIYIQREAIGSWYRELPVVIAAWHCPAPPPQP